MTQYHYENYFNDYFIALEGFAFLSWAVLVMLSNVVQCPIKYSGIFVSTNYCPRDVRILLGPFSFHFGSVFGEIGQNSRLVHPL